MFGRFMAVKNIEQIRKGRWVAMAFTLITDCGAVLSGMIGRYLLVGPEGDVSLLGPGAEAVRVISLE